MATAKKAAKKTTAKKGAAKKAAKKTTAKKGAAKRTAKKATGRAAAPAEKLVVATKVRDAVKSAGVSRVDSEFVDALNHKVQKLVTAAAARAQGNKRTTVRPHDL